MRYTDRSMNVNDPIDCLKGVGPSLDGLLGVVGIQTVADLIESVPRRYDDYSEIVHIANLKPGIATVKGVIKQVTGRYVRRGMHITEAAAFDDSGAVKLTWFNQSYRAGSIKPDQEYYITGEFGLHYQSMSIQSPNIELVSEFPVNTARIVPKYRETKGLKSSQIRKLVKQVLPLINRLPETLPDWVLTEHDLEPRSRALQSMHFPESSQALDLARKRLGFEEVFGLTLAALLNKQEYSQGAAIEIGFDEQLAKQFAASLPFKLTDDQRKVIWQIFQDIQNQQPMNRLVEGDVGSGKTVVAVMVAVMAISQGVQVAMMAPTELLARQHAETIYKLLEPLRMSAGVFLLVGGMSPSQKKQAHAAIADGSAKLIVGTQALIQDKVDVHNLGLVIVDEQHRFGVEQRKKLQAKTGHAVHVLHMTATPIPRSLALTLYGELDISVLKQKPGGRKVIETKVCSPNSRKQVYASIDAQLDVGRQAFIICPVITESDTHKLISVESVYEKLRRGEFKNRRVGLLHGKMKTEDKDAVMKQFVDHEIDLLVSTTVIEVGVDIPNATVMLIENAERFGLAQLHQLRGRVGRSDHQGYCYLMPSGSEAPSRRLRALESTTDGFKLAEYDLEIRGPGAIYGTVQHGLLDLRVAKLSDVELIANARQTAQEFIKKDENLLQYPALHAKVTKLRAVTNLN